MSPAEKSHPEDAESPPSEGRITGGEGLHLWTPQQLLDRFAQEDRVWTAALVEAGVHIVRAAEALQDSWREGGRIIYVGAGTSGRLGAVDAAEWGPTFGVDPHRFHVIMAGGDRAFRNAVEGAEDDADAGRRALEELAPTAADCVLAITASGRTPFVLAALATARQYRCRRVLLSTQCRGDDPGLIHVPLGSGAEIVSGSTRLKAAAATQGILQRLSNLCAVGLGWIYAGHMVEMRATNSKLRQRAIRIVCDIAEVDVVTAEQQLQRCDGDIKMALVCLRCDLPLPQARELLQSVDRHLARLERFQERGTEKKSLGKSSESSHDR